MSLFQDYTVKLWSNTWHAHYRPQFCRSIFLPINIYVWFTVPNIVNSIKLYSIPNRRLRSKKW